MLELHLFHKKKDRKFLVAESWIDIDAMQFHNITKILITERRPHYKKLKLLACLLKFSPKFLTNYSEVTLEKLLPLVEWIEETEFDNCKQLLPALRIGLSKKYYGPLDHLQNFRFAEFDFAERKLYEWHQDVENYEALYQFVAILYRPAKADYDKAINKDGDVRELFNSNLTSHYVTKIKKNIDIATCIAITLWYKACRKFITESFPCVFSQPDVDQSEVENCPAYFGLMRAIAEKGTFGTFDDVEQLNIYTALLELESAIIQQRELEEKIKSESL